MKQLWQKEWREQFTLALLGLVVFTLILIADVSSGMAPLRNLTADLSGMIVTAGLQPLVSDNLLISAAFFCGIFGALLGWRQIQSEKHPDLRAFLLHRPVERALILRSKRLSGLALYVVGAGMPLVGLVIYVLMPGHVAAPFEPAMLWPVTAIFLLGLVFYEAGLLTGLRQARWYGSRKFGLGLAVLAAFGVFLVPNFSEALAILAGTGLALHAAVRGAFQSGGYYQDQGWPGKLGLSLSGAATGIIICGLAFGALDGLLSPARTYQYSTYQVTRTGAVYRVTRGGFDAARIVDLNGQPMVDPKTGKDIKLSDFNQLCADGVAVSVDFNPPRQGHNGQWRRYWEASRYFTPWRTADKNLWYLTRDGRLMGYNGISRQAAGILSPPETSGESHFDWPQNYYYEYGFESYNDRELLVSDHALYRVDLDHQTVTTLLTMTNQAVIGGFFEGNFTTNHTALIATRDSIRMFDADGRMIFSAPYEPAWPNYSTLKVHWLTGSNHLAIQFIPDWQINKKLGGTLTCQIEEVGGGGAITPLQKLPALPQFDQDNLTENCLSLVFPPALRLVAERYATENYAWSQWDGLSIVPALLGAFVGWGMGRRYHFPLKDQAAWAVFHLVFGIPGLLAFLGVQEWPAREICPQCRKPRLVDREHCEHCGGKFAPPELNGTEIFEPLAASPDPGAVSI